MHPHYLKKVEMCSIGKRLYERGFAAANEGNLSVRLDDEHVLCTPTMHCKGFMEPDDICTVDMLGNQTDGKRKRTSEVLLHLEIFKQRPDIQSIVHCHPPHATAFGVAREPIPVCVLPEPDIFLGEVPISGYETPGNQNFADTILPFIHKTNIIVLANHGTVSFDQEIERAYWLTEILDAYCKILILAKQLGGIRYLPASKGRELLELRNAWGFSDARHDAGVSDEALVDFANFRDEWKSAQLEQTAFPPHPESNRNTPAGQSQNEPVFQLTRSELEAFGKQIAAEIIAELNPRKDLL